MSSYRESSIAQCLWCDGFGYASYESTTACGCDDDFRCLSCGQHHHAEGDYLEHVTVTGGYGVLLVRIKDEEAHLNYDENCPYGGDFLNCPTSNGLFKAYQLSGSLAENQALAERLDASCQWMVCVAYDRDRAKESATRKYDLRAMSRWVEVLKGNPPPYEVVVHAMLDED